METSNKQQYLKYFGDKTPTATATPKNRLTKQCRRYEQSKMLPHISEQYNFRVTNHLLVNKIINPKRDKIIMNSLELVYKKSNSRNHFSQSSKVSRRKQRSPQKDKKHQKYFPITKQKRRNKIYMSQPSEHISDCYGQTDQLTIHRGSKHSLTKTQCNIFSKSGKNLIIENNIQDIPKSAQLKIGQIKRFHAKTFYKPKLQENSILLSRGSSFINPPGGFGWGPTIIKITHLSIKMNPTLKLQTLLQLELLQRPALGLTFKNLTNEQDEKAIRTIPISYHDLLGADANGGVKFAVRISKIGDFVPLRIWKYSGVECLELGTIDLPLSLYKEKKNDDEETAQKIKWQMKQGSENVGRAVLEGEVSCHLRTTKMVELETQVCIKYKIYPKRYTTLRPKQQ